MARHSFTRGLVFALVAGLLSPIFGARGIGGGALVAVFIHLIVVAPDLRRGMRAAALAAALGLACVLFVQDRLVIVALAGVILALARSAVLYPRPFARALVAEVKLLCQGVFAALIWADLGSAGVLFMAWSFWLVQAGFALLAPSAPSRQEVAMDPFELARHRAEAVLAGRPR
jgi:hypothetical protein